MCRLGLLLCDDVPERLRPRYPGYAQMFARAFAGVVSGIEWRIYDARCGEVPVDIHECDAYVASGSSASVYEARAWIPLLEGFIRRLADDGKPFAGFCFGHQILATALGGQVRRSADGYRIGVFGHEVVVQRAWMRPALAEFVVPVVHQDQVTQLPAGARLLARGASCPNFLMTVGDCMLGIQGHPEFEPAYIGEILDSRRDRIPQATRDAARASLQRVHDNVVVLTWIARFLGLEPRALG